MKMVIALKYMNDVFLAMKVYDEQIRQGWKGIAEEGHIIGLRACAVHLCKTS